MVKKLGTKLVNGAHDLVFEAVHNRCLIYNVCWEDPRIDRRILNLDDASRMVVLTSAGCNTLDYLLDSPAEIHAVDVNPRQNALLHLKLALIEHGDFDDLFRLFGNGSHQAFREIYRAIRQHLPAYARAFWDERIEYFDSTSRKKSFYYYGTSGAIAWILSRYLLNASRNLRSRLFDLLDARSSTCWMPGRWRNNARYTNRSNRRYGAASRPGWSSNPRPWRCWAYPGRKSG